MLNDKREFFTEVIKQQSLCNLPYGQSFGSGTFSIKITSKIIPIRCFELNSIFTKRDCSVLK